MNETKFKKLNILEKLFFAIVIIGVLALAVYVGVLYFKFGLSLSEIESRIFELGNKAYVWATYGATVLTSIGCWTAVKISSLVLNINKYKMQAIEFGKKVDELKSNNNALQSLFVETVKVINVKYKDNQDHIVETLNLLIEANKQNLEAVYDDLVKQNVEKVIQSASVNLKAVEKNNSEIEKAVTKDVERN